MDELEQDIREILDSYFTNDLFLQDESETRTKDDLVKALKGLWR